MHRRKGKAGEGQGSPAPSWREREVKLIKMYSPGRVSGGKNCRNKSIAMLLNHRY